jgi:predicted transcriptional regulator of viral defense system
MYKELKELFESNNGHLLSKQMQGSTFRYHLNKMIERGEVRKIRHGLYVLSSYPTYDERKLLASLIPDGVFCLFSAWSYYELSTSLSFQYHIALHRNTKSKLPEYPPAKLYMWSEKYYALGITEIGSENQKLKYYNLERSVCDAVKFRNKVGEDIMTEVLKSYVRRPDKNIDLLMKYAKTMRMEKIINPYLKSLL